MKKPAFFKTFAPLVILLALIVTDASAAIDSAGVLDSVLERYSAAAAGWAGVIIAAASRLFWILVAISMVWTFGFMAMRRADLGEFFAEFIRFTIFTGFFWWILTNGPRFATSIYASLRQLAGDATGLGGALTPSGIVDIGFAIFNNVLDQSTVWSPVDSMAGILLSLIILVVLALVGINMLLLLVSGWVLAYGGVFFLGFGGSRWTSDMAINYYKTVLGVAAELMAMVLLVGIGKTFLDDYYAHMSAGVNLKEMGVMLIVVVILLMLVNKLPALVSGVITGAGIAQIGIGQFGAGAAIGAAATAAGAAAMGGSMIAAGAASAAGGTSALMAAFSKASENVQTGNDVLTSMWAGSQAGVSTGPSGAGSSPGSSASAGAGTNSSAYAQAAGLARPEAPRTAAVDAGDATKANEGKPGQGAGQGTAGRLLSAATNAGKVIADAGANLARGTSEVAMENVGRIKESAMDRISDTTGGRIAAAIKAMGSEASDQPAFTGDSLSGDRAADPQAEVSAFVNRDSTSKAV